VDREHQLQEHVTGRCKYRIPLLFDRFEFTDHPSHPGFDITGHGLEIDRHTGSTAHHGRPPGAKADARKPPATLRSPAVDSAPKDLTSDGDAVEMSAALAMLYPMVGVSTWVGPQSRLTCAQCFRTRQFRGYLNS